ncbi:MAG: hypothetical protein KJ732_04640 [Candidatus Margulisbacteria bacterium]|nr:hypothetical protein [Candidatus Margulisiibacteriota bacterium]
MVENTLIKIKSIESKAEEIINAERQNSILLLKAARQQQAEAFKQQQEQLKKEQADQILAARTEAEQESKKIETETKRSLAELKKGVEPKISKAKKEILKCLF